MIVELTGEVSRKLANRRRTQTSLGIESSERDRFRKNGGEQNRVQRGRNETQDDDSLPPHQRLGLRQLSQRFSAVETGLRRGKLQGAGMNLIRGQPCVGAQYQQEPTQQPGSVIPSRSFPAMQVARQHRRCCYYLVRPVTLRNVSVNFFLPNNWCVTLRRFYPPTARQPGSAIRPARYGTGISQLQIEFALPSAAIAPGSTPRWSPVQAGNASAKDRQPGWSDRRIAA